MVWEQRWHPLRREWVVVSSHRNERPWLGERVAGGDASRALPPYIQDCYLCPGHVLVFENKGEVVGVSNPHPHCQIYATNFVFKTIEVEAAAQAAHLAEQGRPLFQDILAAEQADGRRLLVRRDQALSFIPYFARYPYETFVAPRATHPSLAHLSAAELVDFAAVLRETLIRFDNLWRMAFPYVMVLHQAPTDGSPHPGFHFHIQIHPPLRKPGLLKYLAGPEIGGGNFLNDAAPEDTAAELQAVASV